MRLEIKTKNNIKGIKITNLDRITVDYELFVLQDDWYKITVPGLRYNLTDILVDGESIRHGLNAGVMSDRGYEIWINGDLSQYFTRIAHCFALDDLLRFKDLKKKYLITESWNEPITGEFVPKSVKNFFNKGEGPNWFHKEDFSNLPYVTYDGPAMDTNLNLDEDLRFIDSKFYGQGQCKSLKHSPELPTLPVNEIKNEKLRWTMKQFGFTDILQMQYVELQPNSVLPVHKDDFTYHSGRDIIKGPTQLYFVLSGNPADIKFKFKNVGLIDVGKPIFINNQNFVHSLIYTGKVTRGVFLAYGIRNT